VELNVLAVDVPVRREGDVVLLPTELDHPHAEMSSPCPVMPDVERAR
jgi:hypothetical protein